MKQTTGLFQNSIPFLGAASLQDQLLAAKNLRKASASNGASSDSNGGANRSGSVGSAKMAGKGGGVDLMSEMAQTLARRRAMAEGGAASEERKEPTSSGGGTPPRKPWEARNGGTTTTDSPKTGLRNGNGSIRRMPSGSSLSSQEEAGALSLSRGANGVTSVQIGGGEGKVTAETLESFKQEVLEEVRKEVRKEVGKVRDDIIDGKRRLAQ